MNTESIIKQFEIVEKSIKRAKLPFETDMLAKPVIEVTLYELIKSYHQIENMIREIDPARFGVTRVESIQYPKLSQDRLFLCPHCGNPDCQSDHK
jgi:hypothetical protein